MAALSGLRERQETTGRRSRYSVECSGAASRKQRCSAQRCGAARVVAALQRYKPWRYKLRRCGVVARVATTLRCCAWLRRYAWLQRCGAATCVVATLRRCSSYGYNPAALQLTWLRRCGVATSVVAMLRRCS